MPLLILLLLLLALVFGPGLWVRRILKKHSSPREDLPGTGGELAVHLVERYELEGVRIETTQGGDHYDPRDRTIRLGEDNYNGKSLTAVATAAHEFGHALQHARNYRPLSWRTRLVGKAAWFERFTGIAIIALPLLSLIPGMALIARMLLLVVVLSMLMTTLIHLVTLPVEFDASFGRALPILSDGGYINTVDRRAVRRVLLACALTYVSSAMMSLLNIGRWFRLLRR